MPSLKEILTYHLSAGSARQYQPSFYEIDIEAFAQADQAGKQNQYQQLMRAINPASSVVGFNKFQEFASALKEMKTKFLTEPAHKGDQFPPIYLYVPPKVPLGESVNMKAWHLSANAAYIPHPQGEEKGEMALIGLNMFKSKPLEQLVGTMAHEVLGHDGNNDKTRKPSQECKADQAAAFHGYGKGIIALLESLPESLAGNTTHASSVNRIKLLKDDAITSLPPQRVKLDDDCNLIK